MAVNEVRNRIYVGNGLDKTLTIIDGNTMRIVRTVGLPAPPIRIDADAAGQNVAVVGWAADPAVMIVSDPNVPPSALTITAVTQGAHGTATLDANGNATYTAIDGFSGSDSYTYTETDGDGVTTTGTVSVTVIPTLSINGSLPVPQEDQFYSQALTATGGIGPILWTVVSGQIPSGLTLGATTGVLSGYISSPGTYTFTVQLVDAAPTSPQSTTRTFTIVVGPPIVTTTSLPNAFVNTPYSQQLTVGGTTAAVTWTLNTNNSPLLTWLSLSSDGVLSGTPPRVETTPVFTVTATDALNQVASRTLAIGVGGLLYVITDASRRRGARDAAVAAHRRRQRHEGGDADGRRAATWHYVDIFGQLLWYPDASWNVRHWDLKTG